MWCVFFTLNRSLPAEAVNYRSTLSRASASMTRLDQFIPHEEELGQLLTEELSQTKKP